MIAMHKNQPSLQIKNPKKNNIQHQNRSEKRSARELTVCASSRWNPRQTSINGSETKKTRFAVHGLSKNYVNTTSHKYVAKTESQQREELHTRTMQSATPFSSSASVSMEQSIHAFSLFSKETENKRSFTSDKVEFSHYICPNKIQKLIGKYNVRVHLETQFTAT